MILSDSVKAGDFATKLWFSTWFSNHFPSIIPGRVNIVHGMILRKCWSQRKVASDRWRHICANGHSWSDCTGGGSRQYNHIPVLKCGCTGTTNSHPCSLISCVLLAQIRLPQPPCHSLYITYYFMGWSKALNLRPRAVNKSYTAMDYQIYILYVSSWISFKHLNKKANKLSLTSKQPWIISFTYLSTPWNAFYSTHSHYEILSSELP